MQRTVLRKESLDGDERRVMAIYTAHDKLEADLAKLDALRETFDKYKALGSGFDITPTLKETIDKTVADGVTCIRLFSPNRCLVGTRGLSTVATLYHQRQPRAESLRNFLNSIAARFDGHLPYALTLAGAHALRRISPSVAADFLHNQVDSYREVELKQSCDTVERKLLLCICEDDAVRQAELQSLFALYATCVSDNEEAGDTFRMCVTELRPRLAEGVAEQLMEHYAGLRAEAQSRQSRLKVRHTQRAETRAVQAAVATQITERAVQQTAPGAAPLVQEDVLHQHDTLSSPRSFSPWRFAQWRWNAARLVLGLFLLLFCRFVALRLWQRLAGGLRGSSLASARRRTLTL